MANPFKAPEHDQSDPYRHWTNAYKLKRLRIYAIIIYAYYVGLLVWSGFITLAVMQGRGLPWWKIGVVVSTFILSTCAALLVRHYRQIIEKRMAGTPNAKP